MKEFKLFKCECWTIHLHSNKENYVFETYAAFIHIRNLVYMYSYYYYDGNNTDEKVLLIQSQNTLSVQSSGNASCARTNTQRMANEQLSSFYTCAFMESRHGILWSKCEYGIWKLSALLSGANDKSQSYRCTWECIIWIVTLPLSLIASLVFALLTKSNFLHL